MRPPCHATFLCSTLTPGSIFLSLLHESKIVSKVFAILFYWPPILWQAKIFHYGSISLITEPCKSAHIAAAKAAKDSGAVLSYDPNLRLPLWPSAESAREGILSIWKMADIIKVSILLEMQIMCFGIHNLFFLWCKDWHLWLFQWLQVSEEEISFLTQGEDPYDDAVVLKLFHPNLKLLLVTEGPDGCRYYTKVSFAKIIFCFATREDIFFLSMHGSLSLSLQMCVYVISNVVLLVTALTLAPLKVKMHWSSIEES